MKKKNKKYVYLVERPDVILEVVSPAENNGFEYMVCKREAIWSTEIVTGPPNSFIPLN